MPVPQPTHKSDADTLPDPELNPLLNPLLAAHMGRWAEVYFTNPPEKREQAVAELLRELESFPPPQPTSVQVANERVEKKLETAESPNLSAANLEPLLTCSVCAYNNSAGQRFCGMCAAPLQVSPESHAPQVAEAAPDAGASWCERSLGGNSVEYAMEPALNVTGAGEPHSAPEPAWPLAGKLLSHFSGEWESIRFRNRFYVGAVLVIFFAVLGYMVWRGTEALSSTAGPRSAPTRAIRSAQPAPAALTQTPGATGSVVTTSAAPASRMQNQMQADASSQKTQAADARPAAQIVPVVASSSAIAGSAQSGAEELAMAEKYLNGSQGMNRDSKEAAQWLWKAVSKRNDEATLVLSDLYLRGDGVPKSCDQARLLLDAAARKGGRAAAERLRNLQAFGCQ
jgi:hypothetical protein